MYYQKNHTINQMLRSMEKSATEYLRSSAGLISDNLATRGPPTQGQGVPQKHDNDTNGKQHVTVTIGGHPQGSTSNLSEQQPSSTSSGISRLSSHRSSNLETRIPPIASSVYFSPPRRGLALSISSLTQVALFCRPAAAPAAADEDQCTIASSATTSTLSGVSTALSLLNELDSHLSLPRLDIEITQMDIVRMRRNAIRTGLLLPMTSMIETGLKVPHSIASKEAANSDDDDDSDALETIDLGKSKARQSRKDETAVGLDNKTSSQLDERRSEDSSLLVSSGCSSVKEPDEGSIPSWSFVVLGDSLEEDREDMAVSGCSEDGSLPSWSFVLVGAALGAQEYDRDALKQ